MHLGVYSQTCSSPLHNHYTPEISSDASVLSGKYVKQIEDLLSTDLQSIDHKHKRELNQYYTKRVESLSKLSQNGHFYYNKNIQDQIDAIGNKLVQSNTINNSNRIQWVINRSGNPNAACFGEGTLMINLGLLSNMQNLDQVAFVMAHELAHHHLNHVNDGIEKRVAFENSKTLQKKLKDVKNDKDSAREDLLTYLDEQQIDNSKHSRAHESETDKLGYEFYTKAGFPANQAVEALKILKNIDLGKYPTPDIKTFFSDLDLVWKDSWTKTTLSGLSLIKPSEAEIEKYRTHPDTDKRVKQLIELGGKESENNLDQDWCNQTTSFDVEILKYSYWAGNRFTAFAHALQLYEQNPDNKFIQQIAANCMADFVIARDNHIFSTIVPPPNIKMKDHIFDVATFLDNINYSALKKFSIAWIKDKIEFQNNEKDEGLEALKIKLGFLEEKDVTQAIEKFTSKYPDSHYF